MIFSQDLTLRCRQPELMDDPELAEDLHYEALRGLALVNRISRTGRLFWNKIVQQLQRPSDLPFTILDVACGGGDVARALAKLARKSCRPVHIQGCDMSPRAIKIAKQEAEKAGVHVEFFVQDALDPFQVQADVVCCSLFLHHLSEADAVRVLAGMKSAARRMVLVQDLSRSRLGYLYAWFGVRLLTRSRICHVDGPLSVRSAFTAEELRLLANRAGLESAAVTPHWPERLLLTWRRNADD